MVRTAGVVLALGAIVVGGAEAAPARRHAKRVRVARAATPAPAKPPAFLLPPPPPEPEHESRFGVVGQKDASPQTRMSQAGVAWALGSRLSLQLSYERTAYAPLSARDHDDGILTGLRLNF